MASFSIDAGNAPVAPAQVGGAVTQLRANPTPVGRGNQVIQGNGNGLSEGTLRALGKLGSDLLAPKIKEDAQRQYMQGVERAMQGEAVKDIVESRPWYTEIFGPSASVQGARAYTMAQQVAKFGADMERQMPKLREQGPEALTAAFQETMAKLQTGDEGTDMAITSQFVEQMAPLYKRHAKEHYVWQQEKASAAQLDAWVTLGSAYQQRAKAFAKGDGTVTAEDMEAETSRLVGSLIPFADQGGESHERNMVAFVEGAAANGDFHTIAALKKAGVYDKIDPRARLRLDGILRQSGQQALGQALLTEPGLAVEMAKFTYDTARDPRTIPEAAARLNKLGRDLTGADVDLVTGQDVERATGMTMQTQAREDEQATKVARTAEAKQAEQKLKLSIAESLATPQPGGLGFRPGPHADSADGQAAGMNLWLKNPDPKARASLLNYNKEVEFKDIQAQLSTSLNTKEFTLNTQHTLDIWRSMDDIAKGKYFSKDQQETLTMLDSQLADAGGAQAAGVWQSVLAQKQYTQYKPRKNDKSELAAGIRQYVQDKHTSWFGSDLSEDGQAAFLMAVAKEAASGNGLISDKTAAIRAAAAAEQRGRVGRIGTNAWLSGTDNTTSPLRILEGKGSNMGTDEAGEAFDQYLENKAKELGVVGAEKVIYRLPDAAGRARFSVQWVNGERTQSHLFTTDEVAALGKAKRGDAEARAQAKRDMYTKPL